MNSTNSTTRRKSTGVWITAAIVLVVTVSVFGGTRLAAHGGANGGVPLESARAHQEQGAPAGSDEAVQLCVQEASGQVQVASAGESCRPGWTALHVKSLAPAVQVSGAALDAMVHPVSQPVTDAIAVAFGLGGPGDIPASGADDVIAMLDQAGVELAVMMAVGFLGLFVADDAAVSDENDFVAEEVAKFPGRLLGFCGINPLLPGAAEEIDRCLDLDGMVGIKLNPLLSGMDLAISGHADALAAVFARAEAHNAPVQLHMHSPTDPGLGIGALSAAAFENLVAIIQEHPGVRVSHSHCGGVIDEHTAEQWLQRMRPDPGVAFLDLSHCLEHFETAPSARRELIVWRLRQWGVENLLFSSDHVQVLGFQTTGDALESLSRYLFTQEEIDVITSNDGSAWLLGE